MLANILMSYLTTVVLYTALDGNIPQCARELDIGGAIHAEWCTFTLTDTAE